MSQNTSDPAHRRDGPTGEDDGSAADAEPGVGRPRVDRPQDGEPPATEPAGPASGTPDAARSADELIDEYDEERPSRRLSAGLDRALVAVCFAVSVFVLWQVFAPLQRGNQYYLILFLAAVLPLVFVCYRARRRRVGERVEHDNPGIGDWLLAGLALLVCLYPVLPITIGDSGGGFDAFLDRQGSLTVVDIAMGTGLTLLVLEACRRTTGLVLPLICVAFFLYAYYGGFLPISWPIGHAGFDFSQIINGFYNDQSGIYGIPLDVCATYIVLFTIYGAVLDATGAGRFFIDLSFAAFRKSRSAPGRTVTLSGFLLGSVSGSGTATAVSLGSVCWPILRRAGYPKEQAGGMLAAAGIGAILSPPTLGAAAFIIAEYVGRALPAGAALGHDPDAALLPGHHPGRRDRRPPVRRARGARPDPLGRQAAAALRLPLPVPVRDHLLPGPERAAVPRGGLRDDRGRAVRPGGAGGLAAATR